VNRAYGGAGIVIRVEAGCSSMEENGVRGLSRLLSKSGKSSEL